MARPASLALAECKAFPQGSRSGYRPSPCSTRNHSQNERLLPPIVLEPSSKGSSYSRPGLVGQRCVLQQSHYMSCSTPCTLSYPKDAANKAHKFQHETDVAMDESRRSTLESKVAAELQAGKTKVRISNFCFPEHRNSHMANWVCATRLTRMASHPSP